LARQIELDVAFHATLERLGITGNPVLRATVGRTIGHLSTEILPTPGDTKAQIILIPYGVLRVWARRVGGYSLWLYFEFDDRDLRVLAVSDRHPVLPQ
jgi:hypothetical protein